MPRYRHNDTKDPTLDPCKRCGHLRFRHKPACTATLYDPFDPDDLVGIPCPCVAFVQRPLTR